MTRPRYLKAKPGQLVAGWGKSDGMVDICFAWGDGVSRSDAHLLNTVFASKRFRPTGISDYETTPSLIKELESRGYDITTLKFSVEKKK